MSRRLLFVTLLGLFVAGCQPVREAPPQAKAPPVTTRPLPDGFNRYRVVTAESEIRALVYRDGPLARLGHNHVLASNGLTGTIDVGPAGTPARFALGLPVGSFSVDDAARRAEEGADFAGTVEPEDIAGTRKNLESPALFDAARFPEIRLTGVAADDLVRLELTVKGKPHELAVPARVERSTGELRASGELTVTHAQLGLTPFAVMGGLLAVRDEIRLRYRIVARPAG